MEPMRDGAGVLEKSRHPVTPRASERPTAHLELWSMGCGASCKMLTTQNQHQSQLLTLTDSDTRTENPYSKPPVVFG
ncbi:hypothetical protein T265_08917 [Opisthorchis viverrini]|uniref:Uncharacterized protein n=1 Tax=Opisthorchis viverrini TaxID=6198 RepID=A0A074ZIL9_OPIVI|nr:hypothetical protein T265_08917 [Opisthorchis viverrini]KER23150.1 hypothetical protein T265_08917 [Opisthorchis viverrini]